LRLGAAVVFALLATLPVHARVRHGEAWARDNFTKAERMREALNGRPAPDRSRRDYQRVIDAYRRVYFGSPTSSKADASVVAVAELQVEMGRRFHDKKILQGAIQEYTFLRHEYPGSRYRIDALFTIGEIYKDDLDDPNKALSTFQEFLRHYPRSRSADNARQAIAHLKQEAIPQKAEPQTDAAMREAENYQRAADLPGKPLPSGSAADTFDAKSDSTPGDADENDSKADGEDVSSGNSRSRAMKESAAKEQDPGKLPRVTGIRHWSTPDYTRVAIDLEEDVKFASSRIDHPDRIFFDLPGTKLASTLVGKSFDVDDGFLKKIRVAQFKSDKTRVVLEVDNLSDYDAFLLSNPTRLIIDVHGKDSPRNAKTGPKRAALRADDDPDSIDAGTSGGRLVKAVADDAAADADLPAGGADLPGASLPSASLPGASLRGKSLPEDKVENTKPTVTTVMVGKHPVKKIVEADDEEIRQKPAARSVEDLRPDVSAAPSTMADASDRDTPPDDALLVKKPSRAKSKRNGAPSNSEDLGVREAQPTAAGDRSLIRALGLKIGKIVIDPGHGGHDTGTIGPDGLREKDLVLDVGRRLGKLLESRMGAEVVYTRRDDTFVPLETRTAIANQQRADLFVSIHANSSHDPNARGVETYYLNFTASPDAMEVAARENAVSEKSIYELGDLVKKIALKEKIEESHEFASNVQQALQTGLGLRTAGVRDRGVKKAPFIVLIGANMPSILAEISFVSNPTDERKLDTSEYRQRIAESLYRGIAKYASGLSGVRVAGRVAKNEGQ
jgi:N-acetylmuramoyl-L-alanine amidase